MQNLRTRVDNNEIRLAQLDSITFNPMTEILNMELELATTKSDGRLMSFDIQDIDFDIISIENVFQCIKEDIGTEIN